MTINKDMVVKGGLIFGGAYLIFALTKPSKNKVSDATAEASSTKSFDSTPVPTKENARIVFMAYSDALSAGENGARLTELNKECLSEFGMKCYLDTKTNQVVVCDASGATVSF